MSDVTISTDVLLRIEGALLAIESLTPTPPSKTGYALAKWATKVEEASLVYRKRLKKLYEAAADKDDKGRAKYEDLGHNRVKYAIGDVHAVALEEEQMLTEEVTLAGLRPITLAELGTCPVGHGVIKVLLGTVIIDAEPA